MSDKSRQASQTHGRKPPFLACYDYGMGGVWLLLDAPSWEAAQNAYPEFIVFMGRPELMTEDDELEYRTDCERIGYRWNIADPPTGWLKEFFDREPSQGISP